MAFNIFLSIFLILQFFFLFVALIGIAAKQIMIEKNIEAIARQLSVQTEINQVQANFFETFVKTTLSEIQRHVNDQIPQREAASKKKKED